MGSVSTIDQQESNFIHLIICHFIDNELCEKETSLVKYFLLALFKINNEIGFSSLSKRWL